MAVRRLALFASIGPVLFWVIVAILTSLEWNFLHSLGWRPDGPSKVPYPSSTALGPYGWLQVINFGQAGLALIALAAGLWRTVRARVGVAFVFLAAVALLASMFKTDPSNGQPMTWHGWIHALAFVFYVVTSVGGAVALAVEMRKNDRWRWVGFSGSGLLVLAILFGVASNKLVLSLPYYIGPTVLVAVWYELLALRLLLLRPQRVR